MRSGAYTKPFTAADSGKRFCKCCVAAGLDHGSEHELREAATGRCADLGCSAFEVMAITRHLTSRAPPGGVLAHASPKEAATYTKRADRRRLTDSALGRVTGPKPEQELSNLSESLDKSSDN